MTAINFDCWYDLIQWIKHERRRLGITRAEFARQIGLSDRQVGNIENGRYKYMRVNILRNMAAALGHKLQFTVRIGDPP